MPLLPLLTMVPSLPSRGHRCHCWQWCHRCAAIAIAAVTDAVRLLPPAGVAILAARCSLHYCCHCSCHHSQTSHCHCCSYNRCRPCCCCHCHHCHAITAIAAPLLSLLTMVPLHQPCLCSFCCLCRHRCLCPRCCLCRCRCLFLPSLPFLPLPPLLHLSPSQPKGSPRCLCRHWCHRHWCLLLGQRPCRRCFQCCHHSCCPTCHLYPPWHCPLLASIAASCHCGNGKKYNNQLIEMGEIYVGIERIN